MVNAPNGTRVTLNLGGARDVQFNHGQLIENEALAKQFPRIMVQVEVEAPPAQSQPDQVEAPPAPKKELLSAQVLTEPAPVEEVVEPDKPVLSLEDQVLTEPAPEEPVKKESKKKRGPKSKTLLEEE